ncbi:MAG: YgfZ/GcvT domain-containing protein, partial [Solirubrobacterales bacterium]
KMRADMRILRTGDGLLLVCERRLLPVIRHTIDTFRIGYFFKTEDLTGELDRVTLIGPSARATLTAFTDAVSQLGTSENDHIGFELTDAEATALVVGPHELDLLVPTSAVDTVVDRLEAEIRRADETLAEVVRVESGTPAFGKELDENTIPGEAGLNDRAVSFEKGCYVGQETVARMHYKGKPNRNLRALTSELPLEDGVPVVAKDGRELGSVGTAVVSPEHGPIALAVLRREAVIGDEVTVAGQLARVVDTASLNTN